MDGVGPPLTLRPCVGKPSKWSGAFLRLQGLESALVALYFTGRALGHYQSFGLVAYSHFREGGLAPELGMCTLRLGGNDEGEIYGQAHYTESIAS